jgi:NAD(P)-dependent dehydrogenase (short-subunit alcohol dehydrogenase family)
MSAKERMGPLGGAKAAIVTGASRGIGLNLAKHLAVSGWQVAIGARNGELLAAAADQIERAGGHVVARTVDVSEIEAVGVFVDEVVERLGPPYSLVNNAAVLGPVGALSDVPFPEIEAALRVNLLGVMACTAAVVPHMTRAGGGVILNLSGGGVGGPSMAPRLAAYTTSKVAVAGLTETQGRELADSGIRVNAIAPGSVATTFTEGIVSAGPDVAGRELYEATIRNRQSSIQLDRFFQLVDFVLSEDAAWLTGRLLSARWDSPQSLLEARGRIASTSLLQLRRIDDNLYCEK